MPLLYWGAVFLAGAATVAVPALVAEEVQDVADATGRNTEKTAGAVVDTAPMWVAVTVLAFVAWKETK